MNAIDLQSVFQLPVEDRIRIVEEIWGSIADGASQVELTPQQSRELDRRVAEFDTNPEEGICGSEVKRRVMGGE